MEAFLDVKLFVHDCPPTLYIPFFEQSSLTSYINHHSQESLPSRGLTQRMRPSLAFLLLLAVCCSQASTDPETPTSDPETPSTQYGSVGRWVCECREPAGEEKFSMRLKRQTMVGRQGQRQEQGQEQEQEQVQEQEQEQEQGQGNCHCTFVTGKEEVD